MLDEPPEREWLYECAGHFVRLASALKWPMNHLASALNQRNGSPINYWRLGTRLGQTDSIWGEMRDGGYIAIGWENLGDLSAIESDGRRDAISQKLEIEYPSELSVRSRKAGEIRNFLDKIDENDVVLAADGENILGVGPCKRAVLPSPATNAGTNDTT